VVLVSHRFWKESLSADPSVMGRTLTLDGVPHTVVGVMPPSFDVPAKSDLWTPLGFTPEQKGNAKRHTRFLQVLARVKQGVTVDQARADLDEIGARIREENKWKAQWSLSGTSLMDRAVGSIRTSLFMLLGAVGLVLLIACGNVANLLLARAAGRQREMALRGALGATRGRLMSQLLTESVLLSLIGGAVGLLLAYWGVETLLAAAPESLPRASEIQVDWGIAAVTLGISVFTGVLFGLAPALHASRVDINQAMSEGARDTGSRMGRLRAALVIGQVALALVLLLGAGLMLRSFAELSRVNYGFDPNNALTAKLAIPAKKYADEGRMTGFYAELLRRVAVLPGVTAVGGTSLLPMTDTSDASFDIEGYSPAAGDPMPNAELRFVTPDYFRAMKTQVISGRELTDSDREGSAPSVVINQALAKRFFPGSEPLGKRVRPMGRGWVTVVGVVGDIRERGLDKDVRPALYFSALQTPTPKLALVVRASVPPETLANSIRRELAALDPDLPLYDVVTLETIVERSVGPRRFSTDMLTLFAAVALMLSAVGIYGLVSYSVTRRTRELGIRMALGANAPAVVRMVLGQSSRLAVSGVVIGLGAGLFLTRLMAGLLYGVGTLDPWTLIGVPVLMIAVALLASALPAWRATRVHPVIALRSE
jgi:predicted permease